MSITNQLGDNLKAFARLKIDWNAPRSTRCREELKRGDVLETAHAHGRRLDVVCLATPGGSEVQFTAKELEIFSEDQDGAAAFVCLINTLQTILALDSESMTEEDRARVGRWLLPRLVQDSGHFWDNTDECYRTAEGARIEGNPPQQIVRTIRDLTVGELIDAITDAQAPCIVI